MCRGKSIFIGCLLLLVSSSAQAQKKPSVARSPSASSTKAKKPKISRFGIGAGYLIFSETLQVDDGAQSEEGFANYSGLTAFVDYTQTRGRSVYGAAAGMASGKATLGGLFAINYPDSAKRSWSLIYLSGSAYYRLRANVMFGAGLLIGQRSADWKSNANPQVQAEKLNKVVYAPEILMRWNVSRNVTLTQALGTPDFRGSTIWRWSAQFNL